MDLLRKLLFPLAILYGLVTAIRNFLYDKGIFTSNSFDVPVIAVGAITEADQVNSIVAAGRADLCALARPHLTDAAWTLKAAVEQGFTRQWWPRQYLAGKAQAERESGRKPLRGAA